MLSVNIVSFPVNNSWEINKREESNLVYLSGVFTHVELLIALGFNM
jgi:hypothetical protein